MHHKDRVTRTPLKITLNIMLQHLGVVVVVIVR